MTLSPTFEHDTLPFSSWKFPSYICLLWFRTGLEPLSVKNVVPPVAFLSHKVFKKLYNVLENVPAKTI